MYQAKEQHATAKQGRTDEPHRFNKEIETERMAHLNSQEEWWCVLASLKAEAAAARAAQGLPESLRQAELDLWNE
jgi:hypothetical protein